MRFEFSGFLYMAISLKKKCFINESSNRLVELSNLVKICFEFEMKKINSYRKQKLYFIFFLEGQFRCLYEKFIRFPIQNRVTAECLTENFVVYNLFLSIEEIICEHFFFKISIS